VPLAIGEVNGDGLDDLIIGATEADSNGKLDTGKSYVIFGFSQYLEYGHC
jgi:hypothetical protein